MIDIRGRLDSWGPLLVVVVLVAVTGAVGAVMLQSPSGGAILDNVEQRYEGSETVVGAATVVAENGTTSHRATVEYVATDDNNTRVTVTGADGETAVIGTNGSVAWTYQPATGIVRTFDNGTKADEIESRYDRGYADRVERFGENLTATRAGTEAVDGQEAYVLDITSENESVTASGRLWVDRDDWTVLRSQVVTDNGTVTVTATETRFDVSVDESTFRAPDETGRLVNGAERDRFDDFATAQSATDLSLPDLRDTDTFEGALVAGYEGTTTATAVYGTDAGKVYVAVSDGDSTEWRSADGGTTTVADTDVTVASTRGGSVVYWSDAGTTTAVVTRGPPETATDVAKRLLQEGR